MQFFQYAVQMLLVFPVCFYVQPDTDGIARDGASKKPFELITPEEHCERYAAEHPESVNSAA